MRAGYHVWWDQKLQMGGAWELELDRQVMLAGCVIVLWSKRSAASSWVRHEASAAMGRDRYLPITVEKMEVPDPFGRIHAADLADPRDPFPNASRTLAIRSRSRSSAFRARMPRGPRCVAR
jgi:hypothetical protein